MLFKAGSYKKVKMTIRDREEHEGFNFQKERFLSNIRWRFAFRDVIEKAQEKTKEEDGVKYVYSEYRFAISYSKLSSLKQYISDIDEYVDFTVEIEELY